MNRRRHIPGWVWVPTLYFAEGIPYFVVNNISTILFKKLGVPNGEMALFTSLLYLPWMLKPLWSPFVDVLKTKRWWILAMQLLVTCCFCGLTLTLPMPDAQTIASGTTSLWLFRWMLIIFWLTAFASATHDIAADGFYMLSLTGREQSVYVGVRSIFYRLSNLFTQGALVIFAGVLEARGVAIPRTWQWTLLLVTLLFALLSLYHLFLLPRPAEDRSHIDGKAGLGEIFREMFRSFSSFFRKPQAWVAILFLLLYRLPEAFSLKIVPAFMVDSPERGGLALSTASYGFINNTLGVIGILLGGLIGGVFISRAGLRRSLWPMALSLALPCAVYLWMSITATGNLWLIGACVFVEQLGYGFGFTAYMLYMIYVSDGEFKTSHYALCTAFMAASMMLPGMVAGYMQEAVGYTWFFVIVMVCCLHTAAAVLLVRPDLDPLFGTQDQ